MKDVTAYNNEDFFDMGNQRFVVEFIGWTRFMFLPNLQAFNWNDGMFLFARARKESGLCIGSLKGLYDELCLLEDYGIPLEFRELFIGLKKVVEKTIEKKEDLMVDAA